MRRIVTIIVILAVVIGLGFVGYKAFAGKEASPAAALETVPVERGTIVATVNASGSIAPEAKVTLAFKVPGRVAEVLVKEGDWVEAGEPLARLETADLEVAVAQAKAALATAQASLAQVRAGAREEEIAAAEGAVAAARGGVAAAKATLAQTEARTKLAVAAAEAAVAQAQGTLDAAKANLASAEAQLAKVQAGASDEDLTMAQLNVEAARVQLAQLQAYPDERTVEIARENWEVAKNSLWQAQLERDAIQGQPVPGYQKDLAKAAVAVAESSTRIAELQYLQAQEGASDEEIRLAQIALSQAQAQLAKLESPAEEDLAMAQAAVDAARARVQTAQAGKDAAEVSLAQAQAAVGEVAIAQAQLEIAEGQLAQGQAQLDLLKAGASAEQVAVAEAQVDQARAALKQAELPLGEATIVAPFAGTVAYVGVEVGELTSSTKPAIILVDLSSFHIDVRVDETDIGRISVGQEASITLDAFPDVELKGRVARIDPAGTVIQGIVSYGVTIEIAPTEVGIKPDMTANVDVVIENKEGVLLVPNRAIGRDREGEYVEVLAAGQPQKVYIETGLSNGTSTEVVAGLREGERVIIKTQRQRNLEELMEIMGR